MWKQNVKYEDKMAYERLGNILTFWYPASPKTYGLTFFRDFLEMHSAWERFLKNFHNVGKREGFGEYFRYVLKSKDYKDFLSWAFLWGDTQEGVQYWSKINDLLKEFLKEREDEGIVLTSIAVKKTPTQQPRRTKNLSIGNVNYSIEPIYALLSGATNVMQMVEDGCHSMRRMGRRKPQKLGFKVPITTTSIFGTSL